MAPEQKEPQARPTPRFSQGGMEEAPVPLSLEPVSHTGRALKILVRRSQQHQQQKAREVRSSPRSTSGSPAASATSTCPAPSLQQYQSEHAHPHKAREVLH